MRLLERYISVLRHPAFVVMEYEDTIAEAQSRYPMAVIRARSTVSGSHFFTKRSLDIMVPEFLADLCAKLYANRISNGAPPWSWSDDDSSAFLVDEGSWAIR